MSKRNSNALNRILKRIRTLFCSFHHDEENSTSTPIEAPVQPEICVETPSIQLDESPAVVYRENFVKPSLLFPREYFRDLLTNPRSIRRDVDFRCSYPNHRKTIYPPVPFSQEEFALAEFRRLSMLTWSRSVRRLNNEYRSTLNALEQIKEQIERNETKENFTSNQRIQLSRSPVENVSFPPFSSVDNDDEQSEEETTYTVEIIYRKIDENSDEKKEFLIVRKQTTEEQFNSANTTTNDSTIRQTTEKVEDSSAETSSNSSFVIRKRPSFSDSSDRTDSPPSIDRNRVRSIIKQMNNLTTTTTTTSSSSRVKSLQSNRFEEEEELLNWCQNQLNNYSISIKDFSPAVWSDGLVFCALIDHLFPNQFVWSHLSSTNGDENFRLALKIAEEQGGIPSTTLNPSDLRRTLIPYLHLLLNKSKTYSS